MSTGIKRLFDELRATSVAVIHPPGADCNVLLDQLRRIGCRVRAIWPCPPTPPTDTDVVFVLVPAERGSDHLWSGVDCESVVIALVEYENPTVLKAILDLNAQAVINKPFRPTGVLSTLILARSAKGYRDRLLTKVKKLEETLRSRREIERAVKLLAERQGPVGHSGLRADPSPGHQQTHLYPRSLRGNQQRGISARWAVAA